ncbi:unnamed protein product [Arctogadus glacialis]
MLLSPGPAFLCLYDIKLFLPSQFSWGAVPTWATREEEGEYVDDTVWAYNMCPLTAGKSNLACFLLIGFPRVGERPGIVRRR